MANRRFGWHSGSVHARDLVLAGDMTVNGDFTFGSAVTDELTVNGQLSLAGSWTLGIDGAKLSFGGYSTAIALGAISEHAIGVVSHYSASFDDGSNAIPILGKFTLTGDSDSAIVQCVMGQGVCSFNVADMYGVRGSIAISGAPEVNQIFGVFSTVTTTACNMATTGNIAGLATEITGTADITQTGSYAKVSGLYVAWKEEHAMTVDTCGSYIGVFTGAKLDSGYRINASGALTNAFHSYNSSGTITSAMKIDGAHTYVLDLDDATTCATTTTSSAATTIKGNILVKTVAGDTGYINVYGSAGS